MTLDLASTEDAEARLAALTTLTQHTRELMDAVATTEVPEAELTEIAATLAALNERLSAARRDTPLQFEITPDGTLRHLGSAVSGACNPYALPLVVESDPDGGVRAEITFRPIHEGPPTRVHGGISAMILDHLLGQAAVQAGSGGMTATLTTRYRKPVPYNRPVLATASVTAQAGRKTWAEGRITLPDHTPLVEATGLFITPSTWPPTP